LKLPTRASGVGRFGVKDFWRVTVSRRSTSLFRVFLFVFLYDLLYVFLSAFLITGFLGSPALVAGQDLSKNPLEGNVEAIRAGRAVFEVRCTECHGGDAKGSLGPDLTVAWASGATDERLFQTIRTGVAGTDMPRSNAPDNEIWSILAYLRSIAVPTAPVESVGDAANGERIFSASCAGCHRINGRGGALGPDLSRIGSRGRTVLVRKIRAPNASIVPGYNTVTLVTSEGRRIRGVKINEDAYSIRIMDTSQRLQGYAKEMLREVIKEQGSLMPAFPVARLNDHDLDDLVRFLSTLRAANAARLP
jgi:putative heme-binding domain-containing protein